MKNLIFALTMLLPLTTIAQWTDLVNPQSEVLGRFVKKGSLDGDAVDSTHIKSFAGINEKTEKLSRHFKLNLGFLKFESHKFDSINIKGITIDYIDNDYLSSVGKNSDNFFVYKGMRATEVYIKLLKDKSFGAKPKNLLSKLLKEQVLSKIPNLDSISIDYNSDPSFTIIKITNPKVYFKVQAIKLRTIDTKYKDRLFAITNPSIKDSATFTMDIKDDSKRSLKNWIVLKNNSAGSTIFLRLKRDLTTKKLQVYLDLDQTFANLNKISKTYIVSSEEIDEGVIDFKENEKMLGSFSYDDYETQVFVSIDATQTSPNTVKFKSFEDHGGKSWTSNTYLYTPTLYFTRYKERTIK